MPPGDGRRRVPGVDNQGRPVEFAVPGRGPSGNVLQQFAATVPPPQPSPAPVPTVPTGTAHGAPPQTVDDVDIPMGQFDEAAAAEGESAGPQVDYATNPQAPQQDTAGGGLVDLQLPNGQVIRVPPDKATEMANLLGIQAAFGARGGRGGPRTQTTITRRTQAPVPEALSRRIADRGRELEDLARQFGELRANAQEAQAEAFEEGMFGAAKIRAEGMRRQAEIQREIQNASDMISANIAQVASRQIDPNRIFKSGSQRIGAALAVATSSIGNALSQMGGLAPTGNSAMRIITNALERDLQAQQVEVNRDLGVISAQTNMFSQLRGQLGDERAAEQTLRAMMWEDVQARLASIDMSAAPESTRLQVEQLLAQAAQQKDLAAAQAIQASMERVDVTKIVRGGGGGRRGLPEEVMKRLYDLAGAQGVQGAATALGIFGPNYEVIPGREEEFRSRYLDEDGNVVHSAVNNTANALGSDPRVQANQRIIRLTQMLGELPGITDMNDRDRISRAQSLARELRRQISVASGQGAMTKVDTEIAEGEIPDFSGGLEWAANQERINTIRDIAIGAASDIASVYGVRFTGSTIGADAVGEAEAIRRNPTRQE